MWTRNSSSRRSFIDQKITQISFSLFFGISLHPKTESSEKRVGQQRSPQLFFKQEHQDVQDLDVDFLDTVRIFSPLHTHLRIHHAGQ